MDEYANQIISNTNQVENVYLKFLIEIQDSGVGISKENLKNLFTDFMKLDEHAKINPQGTGLGLSICKMLVEKMRGEIKVHSEKDEGTTFQIFISSEAKIKFNQQDHDSLKLLNILK